MSTLPWVLFALSVLWFIFYRREVQRQIGVAQTALASSQADADRLAAIVRDYIRICDETAAMLKDENPPSLAAERNALSIHEKLVHSRNSHLGLKS